MGEHSVVVKQNPILARVLLIIIACIFSGFAIAALVLAESNGTRVVAFWLFIVAIVCLFFAITAKLYIRAMDIYTEIGMVRKRGDKILCEIKWQNVERIQYNKLSLISILMFGPTAFYVFQKEQNNDKLQAKHFFTYYSMKEVKKIQTVIPIEIQY